MTNNKKNDVKKETGLMTKLLRTLLVVLSVALSSQAFAVEVISSRPDYSGGTYEEHTLDMKVKVLGGYVSIKRYYNKDGWELHPNWRRLTFNDHSDNEVRFERYSSGSGGSSGSENYRIVDPDEEDGPAIASIHRERYTYKPVSSQNPNLYRDQYDPSKSIEKTADGYIWRNRTGDWIQYDKYGIARKYGNKNNVTVTLVRDEQNRITEIQDHFGTAAITFDYTVSGQITATDYDGRTITYHGSFPYINKVTDVRGNDWQYQYTEIDNKKYLSKKIDPELRETIIGHEKVPGTMQTILTGASAPSWNLEEYTDPNTGETTVRESVDSGAETYRAQFVPSMVMFTHMIYDDGERVDYKYYYNQETKTYSSVSKTSDGVYRDQWFAADGKLKRSAVGGKLLFTRGETHDGSKAIRVDAEGRKTTTYYDQWENPTKIVAPDDTFVTYSYHPKFNYPTQMVDANGNRTSYEYDENGNLTRVTRGAGSADERVTEFEYDLYGQVLAVRQLGNAVTETAETFLEYDSYGNVTQVTDPENFIKKYQEYNSQGQAEKFIDGRDKSWEFTYDAAGNLVKQTSPLVYTNNYHYNKVNNLVKVTDAETNETNFAYDVRDRLESSTNALNETYQIEYSISGLPKEAINGEGHKTRFQYDLQQRLKKVSNEEGLFTEYNYKNEDTQALSRLDSIVTTNGQVKFMLDKRGRIIKQTQASLDESLLLPTQYQFDNNSNVTQVTDAKENSSKYTYNVHNELIKVTNALDHVIELQYDARGNLLKVIDPKQSSTRYEYDKRGLRTAEYRPMGEKTTYEYDADGNLVKVIDAKGQVIEYVYDDDRRLTAEKHYPDQAEVEPVKTITYNYNKNGVMTGYDDGVTSAVYALDKLSRVTNVTTDFGPFSKTYQYSYHKDGELASFTNAENIVSSYSYDKANRLKLIGISGHGSVSFNNYKGYLPTEIVYPGGIKVTQGYDGIGRLSSKAVDDPAGNGLQNEAYQYDAVSNIAQKNTDDGNYEYAYDKINRLINANQPQPLQNRSYQYDDVGNRTGTEIEGQEWNYNANHELLNYGTTDNQVTFEYDQNGSTVKKIATVMDDGSAGNAGAVTSEVTEVYIYNIAGRLSKVVRNGTPIAQYYYDPFGRRLYKQVGDDKTFFLYSKDGLIAEYTSQGDLMRGYQYFSNQKWGTRPLGLIISQKIYYFHHDHRGAANLITSQSGEVVWSGLFDAYGYLLSGVSNVENPVGLPGQYRDKESSYIYNFHRYYNPESGQYLQSDPIGLLGGWNDRIYANSNPTSYIDPLGLNWQSEVRNFHNDGRRFNGVAFNNLSHSQKVQMKKNYNTKIQAMAKNINLDSFGPKGALSTTKSIMSKGLGPLDYFYLVDDIVTGINNWGEVADPYAQNVIVDTGRAVLLSRTGCSVWRCPIEAEVCDFRYNPNGDDFIYLRATRGPEYYLNGFCECYIGFKSLYSIAPSGLRTHLWTEPKGLITNEVK